MYRAQRSSSNGAKEQLQQGAKEQQKGANRSSSFYSATNRLFIVLEPPSVSFKRMGCFVQRKRSFRFRFVS